MRLWPTAPINGQPRPPRERILMSRTPLAILCPYRDCVMPGAQSHAAWKASIRHQPKGGCAAQARHRIVDPCTTSTGVLLPKGLDQKTSPRKWRAATSPRSKDWTVICISTTFGACFGIGSICYRGSPNEEADEETWSSKMFRCILILTGSFRVGPAVCLREQSPRDG